MARAAVRESVTVAGRAERARVARGFTVAVLGPGHPCGNDAVLLVSELFGNSVRHSGSGRPGGMITVTVRAGDGIVWVEVTDRSGPGVPQVRPAGRDAEGGRGLQLVAGLAAPGGGGGAAAWLADSDLVRTAAGLNLPRPAAGPGADGQAGRAGYTRGTRPVQARSTRGATRRSPASRQHVTAWVRT